MNTRIKYGGLIHKPRQKTISDGSAESPVASHPGLSQTHLSGQMGCRATGPRSLSRRSHTYTQDVSSCTRNTAGLVRDHCRPVTARPQVLRSHCRSGRSAVRRCSRMLPSEQPAWGRRGKGITVIPSLSVKLSSQGKFSEHQLSHLHSKNIWLILLLPKHQIITFRLVLTNHKGGHLEILTHTVPPPSKEG